MKRNLLQEIVHRSKQTRAHRMEGDAWQRKRWADTQTLIRWAAPRGGGAPPVGGRRRICAPHVNLVPQLFPSIRQLYGAGSSLPAVHCVRGKRENTAKSRNTVRHRTFPEMEVYGQAGRPAWWQCSSSRRAEVNDAN